MLCSPVFAVLAHNCPDVRGFAKKAGFRVRAILFKSSCFPVGLLQSHFSAVRQVARAKEEAQRLPTAQRRLPDSCL